MSKLQDHTLADNVALSARGLVAGYGNSTIIDGVDFDAKNKEISVVVGPNGSGKSTLLKSMFGLATIHSGTIRWSGKDITHMPSHKIAREGIAYLPQVKNIFTNLSIDENLKMAAYTLNQADIAERKENVFTMFPSLVRHRSERASVLSGGERQMLAMGMALVRMPQVMMFDEPTANLSPKLADEVLDKVTQMRDKYGITIILVEQNVMRALELGNSVTVLANGKMVFTGTSEELLAQPELNKMYLGIDQK